MTEAWRQDEIVSPAPGPGQGAAPPVAAPAAPAPLEEWEADAIQAPSSALNEIDRLNGAPWKLRLAISQARSMADALTVARQAYPDAKWMEFGGDPGGERLSKQTGTSYQAEAVEPERHIVFTHPDTKRLTTVNERGWDAGDWVELGPEVARAPGYVAGAAAMGALTRNPAAMAAGGTAGSYGVKMLTDPLVEGITGFDIPDTRPFSEKAKEAAIDIGMELTGGFFGELTATAFRKIGRGHFMRKRKRGIEKMQGPKGGRPKVIDALEEMADEQGIPRAQATAGALPLSTRSEPVRNFFKAASMHPGASDRISNAVDDTLMVINRDFERIQRGIGVGVREKGSGGYAVQSGLADYATSTKLRQRHLEDELTAIIGPKTKVNMEHTAAMIQEELAKIPPGAKRGGGYLPEDYLDLIDMIEVNKGELPFEYIRAFREGVGTNTSGGVIAPTGAKTKWYNPLYEAITRDMEAVAKAKGKDGMAKFKATQRNWAERETRLELLRTVANSDTSEKAFRAAMSGAEDGPSILAALKKSIDSPKQWDDLVSVKLWDMATVSRGIDAGDEVGKVFSPTKFIGNWAAMSDASKAVLFSPGSELRKSLDRLATVTAALRESKNAIRLGSSGTPQGNAYFELLGRGALAQAAGADLRAAGVRAELMQRMNPLSEVNTANRQAILMTDPHFVRWLADGTAMPATATGVKTHIARLTVGAFATKPPAVKEAIMGYLLDFKRAVEEARQDQEAEPPPEVLF